MSNIVLRRVFLPMLIGLGVSFLLVLFIFQYLGVAEIVWPIIFPILGWTFGMVTITVIIAAFACRFSSGVPSDEAMVRRTYSQTSYPTYDSPVTGAVYIIPVYCPHCMNRLDLDSVEWIGPGDLICPSCSRTVQAGVRENP